MANHIVTDPEPTVPRLESCALGDNRIRRKSDDCTERADRRRNAKASVTNDRRTQVANTHQQSQEHPHHLPRSGRIGFRRARTGRNRYRRPGWPIARRCHHQPTAGAGLPGHREPRRHRCGGPVHAQRGSPWPDVLAHRFRCTWRRRRPRHHSDQQDRLRRRHVLTSDPETHVGRPQWGDPEPNDSQTRLRVTRQVFRYGLGRDAIPPILLTA